MRFAASVTNILLVILTCVCMLCRPEGLGVVSGAVFLVNMFLFIPFSILPSLVAETKAFNHQEVSCVGRFIMDHIHYNFEVSRKVPNFVLSDLLSVMVGVTIYCILQKIKICSVPTNDLANILGVFSDSPF